MTDDKTPIERIRESYTIAQVAQLMRVSKRTATRWCTERKLTHYFVGGRFYVHKDDLNRYIKSRLTRHVE